MELISIIISIATSIFSGIVLFFIKRYFDNKEKIEIEKEKARQTQNDLMQPVMEKALNAIKEVGKENGFTYIFDMNAGILYAAENSQDVLPLVKKKLGLQ